MLILGLPPEAPMLPRNIIDTRYYLQFCRNGVRWDLIVDYGYRRDSRLRKGEEHTKGLMAWIT